MRLFWFSLAALGLGFSGVSHAGSSEYLDSYSCGKSAIEIGMNIDEIKLMCGQTWQPSNVVKSVRPALEVGKDGERLQDNFEKWMFKTVSDGSTHVLLKNGEVIRIFTTQ
ncbi:MULTISPECIES: DUF2845 domain-containing protein [unclassified Methylophaga]|jgi:hypothetical protein|uniref:DUF2845 domain-containing protein n=1 Tax=unclassified Methylophaga TaxID=2629249 RepID=UPI00259CC046|nr:MULTISPECIES: DUF2845 domain-containing protein [unclassified Methylophaga]|tara:strand:+ start:1445 stop:1774 length:330 start_codon:yes stop_codon:yes gene_type:complete